MLPLDWLEDVGVVRHIQANLYLGEIKKHNLIDSVLPPYHISSLLHPSSYLLQSVLVSLIRALKLGHQFSQCAVCQRFVHQVLAAAHSKWSVAAIAVDAQHNMVEAVAWKLGFKADWETLEWRQPVGQVAGQHSRVKEGSRGFYLSWFRYLERFIFGFIEWSYPDPWNCTNLK